jgi:hypothetical protein
MELTFNKSGDVYVAEFKAEGPFALHLEVPKVGHLRVRQTSVEGSEYALVDEMPMGDQYNPVVDRQFVGELWPLWIQVETRSMPTLAVVTFNA